MLTKFIGKGKVLLIPAPWLNAVASILNRFSSPKGTVSAKLEGDGEGSTMNIDIVPSAVAREIGNELSGNFIRKGDASLLGDGLKWDGRGLTIDTDWIYRQVIKAARA